MLLRLLRMINLAYKTSYIILVTKVAFLGVIIAALS